MTLRLVDHNDLMAIRTLLVRHDLPVADISEKDVTLYAGIIDTKLCATVGYEQHEETFLLRSLCVESSLQGRGIGKTLVKHIEEEALKKGIRTLYLLTNSAKEYFTRLGFVQVARNDTPEAIQHTREFSSLCPSMAVIMRKSL